MLTAKMVDHLPRSVLIWRERLGCRYTAEVMIQALAEFAIEDDPDMPLLLAPPQRRLSQSKLIRYPPHKDDPGLILIMHAGDVVEVVNVLDSGYLAVVVPQHRERFLVLAPGDVESLTCSLCGVGQKSSLNAIACYDCAHGPDAERIAAMESVTEEDIAFVLNGLMARLSGGDA